MRMTRTLPFLTTPGRLIPGLLLTAALLIAGCGKSEKAATAAAAPAAPTAAVPATPPPVATPAFAVIETDKGVIEFELLTSDAPKTTENFRLLAERGYYNGLTFHRVVKDFMIQGGDPRGDGSGGESAWGGKFADEIVKGSPLYPKGGGYKRGTVAMANAGPNTNASQFFIVQKDYPLAANYTIFGRVTKGMEVVDQLVEVPTRRGADYAMSLPVTPIVMKKVSVRK